MVQYYYDKFTSIGTDYWTLAPFTFLQNYTGNFNGHKSFTFDSKLNKVTLSAETWGLYEAVPTGSVRYKYSANSEYLYKDVATSNGNFDNVDYRTEFAVLANNTKTITYSKGALVQSAIPVEEGTYPANGRHTDGYWYVRGAVVGPLPPGTVINQPYLLGNNGNGGRKLVRLDNGWLVAAVINTTPTEWRLYVSKNDGQNWELLGYRGATSLVDVALVSKGTMLYVIASVSGTAVASYTVDATRANGGDLVAVPGYIGNWVTTGLTAVHTVSAAIDPNNGHLHVAWAARSSSNANSFNIQYAKSTDGGAVWQNRVQLTQNNVGGIEVLNPSIVVRNGRPVVLARYAQAGNNYIFSMYQDVTDTWKTVNVVNPGATEALSPTAALGPDGTLHVAYVQGTTYLMYHFSKDGGATWSPWTNILPTAAFPPQQTPSITVDKSNTVFVAWSQRVAGSYMDLHIKRATEGGAVWRDVLTATTSEVHLQTPSLLYDPALSLVFGNNGGRPPVLFSTAGRSVNYLGDIAKNSSPTIALISPINNQTLYENDTINISGDAYDTDKDQAVTAYYQINNEARKILATNLSQTQISLSKQLTFKGSKLYDGDTTLTSTLAEGVAHTLKVWAEDSEKALSAIVERSFYVVPNRAPLLSLDAVVPSGVVDADKFKISGTASDQDANSTVKVTRRINSGNAVEIYNGSGGAWEFEVTLSQLVVGQNTIIIEVVDNYGAKTSKTVTLNKKEVKTPILQSVARYKIEPPKGSAKGVLLFIQRDEELDIRVELSMTLNGEQEQFETLTPANTAPVQQGLVEDTFEYEGLEAKQNIILKITPSRNDLSFNHKIHLISGAVD